MDACTCVFPTCVGVFLAKFKASIGDVCLPHVRGGVSIRQTSLYICTWSSPRAWGCFFSGEEVARVREVFPTCVGVFLYVGNEKDTYPSLPHVRGGVSYRRGSSPRLSLSSPRAWGCFYLPVHLGEYPGVFPTCVGVFLPAMRPNPSRASLPHVRGGVSPEHPI